MKLEILQENLSSALSLASRFVNPRAQLPVLSNLKLEAKKTKLSVLATNLEMSLSVSMGAKIDEEGEIAAPAKTLSDLVGSLSKGNLRIEAEKEKIKLSNDDFSGSLLGMDTSDFPQIPQGMGKGTISLDAKALSEALSQTLYVVSIDETRPVLTGVLFMFTKKSLILVATDGFRLSQKTITLDEVLPDNKFILPKNSLMEIMRLKSEDKISFQAREGESQVVFGAGDAVLASRLIEGTFPDFEKIIPKDSQIRVSLDKQEFLKAIKAASVYARDVSNVVKLKVGKTSLKVSSQSDRSGEGEAQVNAKVEGGEIEVSYNYRYLEEYLSSTQGDNIILELSDTKTAGVFRDETDKSYLHIIMPIKS